MRYAGCAGAFANCDLAADGNLDFSRSSPHAFCFASAVLSIYRMIDAAGLRCR